MRISLRYVLEGRGTRRAAGGLPAAVVGDASV